MPDFSHEHLSDHPVCGIDEAGRGPWAGPVVASAVILDPAHIPEGLDDSKRLSPQRREEIFAELALCAEIGVGAASVEEIEVLNILQASLLAMRRAVAALRRGPAMALVDGNKVPPGLPCPARAIVGGDALVLSIAAASIIAKVSRDRMMVALSHQYPGYGWEKNMGYGTPSHVAGLELLGLTPHHRRTFKPIHKILCETSSINP